MAVPLAREFDPQLVLISAGYDAHREDPLADCRVTERGFCGDGRARCARSAPSSTVPLGGVLEGGYALEALARSVAAVLDGVGLAWRRGTGSGCGCRLQRASGLAGGAVA